ncbi:VOC family protein [Candidatus Pantoea bituminis]|uniref:VOC family protein n=1 Tax=Candidatus Pantoea bituminis TaxID=2831036 RepID=UPI001C06302D|nr:VOC family protein [Pantoea bituminis]
MIKHLDHLVLTTRDLKACMDFYTRVLNMELIMFGEKRVAFLFGQQKINVHEYGKEIEPKAHLPVPGSLDICLISCWSTEQIKQHFETSQVEILEGPVTRTGARGPITSFYLRDPDLNLIEISHYQSSHKTGG